jgi:tetratricopeptide (TPR) repeat protein
MIEIQTLPEITRSILSLEQFQFEEEAYKKSCEKLEQLAVGFQERVTAKKERTPFATAKSFRYFLSSEGFGVSTQPEWECFTLCGTLLNNSGSCLGLTTLHVTLGEMSDLPMRTALFEGHIVPVYMDGETPIYIETTRRSSTMYERSIQQLHGKPVKLLSNGEFLAVHLSNRATFVYARVDLMDDAVFLIDSALELFPDYTAGWINRAAMMKKLDNIDEMRRSLAVAKSLNPGRRYTEAIKQIENNIITENIA